MRIALGVWVASGGMNDGSSAPSGGGRYCVERGTDGSWLVVDRGADRRQRTAISRAASEATAREEADTLSELEDVTSTLSTPSSGPWAEIEQIAETTAALDAQHTFNHLLRPAE